MSHQELLESKLKELEKVTSQTGLDVNGMNGKIDLVNLKLSQIYQEQLKTNSRVTKLEDQAITNEIRRAKCPLSIDPEKYEKEIDKLKEETEVIRLRGKNPGFDKYYTIGKFVIYIALLASLAMTLIKINKTIENIKKPKIENEK